MLTFKGAMSQDALVEIGDVVRLTRHQRPEPEPQQIKKLFAIMVEMAQNILTYSSERQFMSELGRDVGIGMIMLLKRNEAFMLRCGNCVLNEQVEAIRQKCEYINTLDKDELRRYYTQELKKAAEPGSNRAGLGLIDIARRSGRPLDYAFHPVKDDCSFFTLSVTLNRKTVEASI